MIKAFIMEIKKYSEKNPLTVSFGLSAIIAACIAAWLYFDFVFGKRVPQRNVWFAIGLLVVLASGLYCELMCHGIDRGSNFRVMFSYMQPSSIVWAAIISRMIYQDATLLLGFSIKLQYILYVVAAVYIIEWILVLVFAATTVQICMGLFGYTVNNKEDIV